MQATRQTTWRPIPGFEGRYEVSDDGQVKALAGPGTGRSSTDRILRGSRSGPGYRQVSLYPGGGQRFITKRIHVLVLEAFVGPRPKGADGRHIDDDRENNHLSNLCWGDRSANVWDMVRNGNHLNARKTECNYGHPLSGDNLYIDGAGRRRCRACAQRRRTEYESRNRGRR